ncbi:hypothetical protein G6F43_005837 [Rhizopus delemar]|nr:hypothetical protein G6F43_005837 [Rhizopus delemar]
MTHPKKKITEYHFIDVNDPERYKKIKVTRACDFCRKRKSKCDLGVPGSGSCSNCKKAKIQCKFSSINHSKSNKKSTEQLSIHYQQQQQPSSFLSVDSKGHCTFEKDMSSAYVHLNLMTTADSVLYCSNQLEDELFEIYFAYLHPFYPILDSYNTLQALKYNRDNFQPALKWIILALALHFHSPATVDNCEYTAATYYQYALTQMDYIPCLVNIQTLLLMYKYQEIITPIGVPFSIEAIQHLKEAKIMIDQISPNSDLPVPWTMENEFVCRASWIWYINLSFSNLADPRCKDMISFAVPPSRLPSLTDTEQYDKTSLNITCNFLHLISLTIIYSQTTCFISNNATLFSSTDHPAFSKIVAQLQVWHRTLPNHLLSSLSADPPPSYPAQPIPLEEDGSKTASFVAYLGLIRDTLELLFVLHQHPFPGAKSALDLATRAQRLTLNDPHLSRFASIQGNRLIVYGLALALQALQYDAQCNQSDKVKNRIDSFMDLAIQILHQIPVSSKLSMAIQDMKHPFPQNNCSSVHYPTIKEPSVFYNTTSAPTSDRSMSAYDESHDIDHTQSYQPSSTSTITSDTHHHHQQQNHHHSWNSYQWDCGTSQGYDSHLLQDSKYRFSNMQDARTPPTEQHTSPRIVHDNYFQSKTREMQILMAPMPQDIINPSFEFYPSKSCKHRPQF